MATKKRANSKPKLKAKPKAKAANKKVRLLAGGNPQIAKGEGNAPVQAYLNAMPGWKSAMGIRLDKIITRAVPAVVKAVKWNSPFYGVKGGDYFLSFHVFARYIKVGFFKGSALQPPPTGASKQKDVRYLDIHEDDAFDEKQFTAWVKQAAKLPGWLATG
jgi:hypothetical protein